MRSKLIGVLFAASMLVACGEDAPVFDSAGQMADQLGCTDLEITEAERVKEAAVCELDGERVSLFVFEDTAQRDEWLQFGEQFSKDLITGPTWAVDPPEGKAPEVQEALL
jgi:hypothetical protein